MLSPVLAVQCGHTGLKSSRVISDGSRRRGLVAPVDAIFRLYSTQSLRFPYRLGIFTGKLLSFTTHLLTLSLDRFRPWLSRLLQTGYMQQGFISPPQALAVSRPFRGRTLTIGVGRSPRATSRVRSTALEFRWVPRSPSCLISS